MNYLTIPAVLCVISQKLGAKVPTPISGRGCNYTQSIAFGYGRVAIVQVPPPGQASSWPPRSAVLHAHDGTVSYKLADVRSMYILLAASSNIRLAP